MQGSKKSSTFAAAFEESCLSGRKSHTRNVVYPLRGTGGSNPSLSAKKKGRFVCLSLLKQAKRSFLFEQGASSSLLGLRRNPSRRNPSQHKSAVGRLLGLRSNPSRRNPSRRNSSLSIFFLQKYLHICKKCITFAAGNENNR